MLEVEMTDDIRRYKSKAMGNFTTRQAAYVFIGVVLGALVAFLLPFPITLRVMIAFLIATPFIVCGFITIDGCTFEVILIKWLYSNVLTPPQRKVKQKNIWRKEDKAYEERRKAYFLRKLPEDKKKQYLKMLENEKNRVVVESTKPEYKIYR